MLWVLAQGKVVDTIFRCEAANSTRIVLLYFHNFSSALITVDLKTMAQQMTMFGKAATSSLTVSRPSKVQRRSAVAVRAGPYDAELVQTAVS